MQKLFTTAAILMALAASAHADGMAGLKPQGAMSGPAQPSGGMSGGMMAGHDHMAGKKKPKHDAMKQGGMPGGSMSGGSMSGPAQPANGGMNH